MYHACMYVVRHMHCILEHGHTYHVHVSLYILAHRISARARALTSCTCGLAGSMYIAVGRTRFELFCFQPVNWKFWNTSPGNPSNRIRWIRSLMIDQIDPVHYYCTFLGTNLSPPPASTLTVRSTVMIL